MAGDEVDTAAWYVLGAGKNIWTADNPAHQTFDHILVAPHKLANIIPERAVPLGEALTRKGTYLVKATGVPGFGYQLAAGQDRIGVHGPDQRRPVVSLPLRIPGQGAGQVKTKSIDVHFLNPVAQ